MMWCVVSATRICDIGGSSCLPMSPIPEWPLETRTTITNRPLLPQRASRVVGWTGTEPQHLISQEDRKSYRQKFLSEVFQQTHQLPMHTRYMEAKRGRFWLVFRYWQVPFRRVWGSIPRPNGVCTVKWVCIGLVYIGERLIFREQQEYRVHKGLEEPRRIDMDVYGLYHHTQGCRSCQKAEDKLDTWRSFSDLGGLDPAGFDCLIRTVTLTDDDDAAPQYFA